MINGLQINNYSGKIEENISLGEKTAFKAGGFADYFFEPSDLNSIKMLMELLGRKNENPVIIGGGTNTLIKDSGIKYGISILNTFKTFKIETENQTSLKLRVEAGVKLQKLCWHCAKRGYRGLNRLIGIPGSFGGAVYMNAGTARGDIISCIEEVNIITDRGKGITLFREDIEWDYRHFSPKDKTIKNYIIVDALISLEKDDKEILYAEAKDIMIKRKKSQPVKSKSAGCFFKNPSKDISAGMLIDRAGLKGKKSGGALVSDIHANFITNTGTASAQDIIDLKKIVQEEVKSKFDILLKEEVKIVGR